jgi:hypothetical protein
VTGPIVTRGRSLREFVPAAYLLRDADPRGGNGMLQALLDLLDAEIATVEDELARRYASLFVETCDDVDLAHFQALLGVTQLPGNQHPRALIGNIIGYRRGKGTIATLERVAAAASGWGAHAVDYFRLLGTTQNINHVRTGATTVPVRAPGPLEWADSPFDPLAHTVDVRAQGRYDIPNVGVHLWRLGPVTTVDPSDAAPTADQLRYRFHPLGIDTPLYSIGRSLDEMSAAAAVQAVDVTEPIRMSQLRDALADYYGDSAEQSVCIYDDGVAIPVTQVSVRALDDRVSGAWGAAPPATRVAIDPLRGRLAFAAAPQGPVTVRFVRARPMEIGSRDVADATPATVELSVGGTVTLDGALAGLPAAGGVVELADSGRYAPGVPLAVAGDAAVTIRAGSGNWPVLDPTGVTIACAAGARLTLTGLLVTGAPLRITGSPAAITLDRCTLVAGVTLRPDGTPDQPDEPSLILDLDNEAGTAVSISGCLTGPVRIGAPDAVVTIADSVLADAAGAGGAGSAHPEPVLVGAPLTPFPAWPDGVAGLRLQVGVGLVLDLRLPTAPTSLDDAAQAIRAALATLALDPDVTAAVDVTTIEVAVHDNRLVLAVPGDDEVSAVDASDTDNAATLLALTGDAGAYSAWSLLGDPVPEQPVLPVVPAHLGVELGPPGLAAAPADIELATQPASVADAAGALQAALPADAGSSPLVLVSDARLRVVPGARGWAVRFVDGAAARALGLHGPAAVLAGSSDGIVPAPSVTADRTSVLGAMHVVEANLSDSIVTGALLVERQQVGCVRYSYVGAGSRTPRRYQCVGPDTAGPPRFASLRFGAAAYAQLTPNCPPQIAVGGEDGSEMGAFAAVREPLRLAAMNSVLAEYLRLTAVGSIFLES